MILCGVCFHESDLIYLTEIGVKDSKKLSAKIRKDLSKLIKKKCQSYKIVIVSPQEIDLRENKRITLNRLEELKMAEIINELKPENIFIDAADVNEERFGKSINMLLDYKPRRLISKHKADDIYPIVSAASIIAKDKRDSLIEDLKQKYGDFGSGYPSDKKTTNFLRSWIKKFKKAPNFSRKTWDTTKRIINEEISNKKITDYFN